MTELIVTGGRVTFEAGGSAWQMRQPSPAEAADGDSAYRLAYNRVLADPRLKQLAGGDEALKREARIRGNTAEAVYLLPLLLERDGKAAFDVFDETSLAEFEALPQDVVLAMMRVLWGPIQQAAQQAKKK